MKPTLLILIALGVVLRFVGLTHQSFWYDETASAVLAAEPLDSRSQSRRC